MKLHGREFRMKSDETVDLSVRPTAVAPYYKSKSHYESLLQAHVEELSRLQSLLYACNRHALLVIFQAMDAAGKDGAIKHVMSGVNPQGCQVFSFRHPSEQELEHDFLWRTTRCLPERGRIGIFNRSYYEEVLIVRVHREILQAEHLPVEASDTERFWAHRYRSILDLEAHLHRNGTRIVKFFLHVSPQEQLRRLIARLDDPQKNWKLSLADLEERGLWGEYMKAYEACLTATSTAHAPWYIVPADAKKNARLIVSSILHETLRELKMGYPSVDARRRRELERLRTLLARQRRHMARTSRGR